MFTGIILAVGKILAITPGTEDVRLSIHTGTLSLVDVKVGDSIAVNGVCLTAVELGAYYFVADVSKETLTHTCLAHAQVDTPVNLELALTPTTRLGGHMVSGHVDGVGIIINKKSEGRSIRLTVQVPDELAKYIAKKGSICINGISLTVNTVDGANFDINIVPHTLKETTLNAVNIGTKVNVEVDILARYMERLMKGEAAAHSCSSVTMELLRNSGFLAR